MSKESKEVYVHGIGVSPGIALGPLAFRAWGFDEPTAEAISREQVESEWERLEQALAATKEDLREIQARLAAEAGDYNAGIFEAHILMLEDRSVLAEVRAALEEKLIGIESVYHQVLDRYAASLGQIDDPYLRERTSDVRDVARRVIMKLAGTAAAEHPTEPHVLIAHDLTPSDTATMDAKKVLGFATEAGSPTSHTAIVARSLGIPAVVALHRIPPAARWGHTVLLDGYSGELIFNPSPETLEKYDQIRAEKAEADLKLTAIRDDESRTEDGRRITLSANIEFYHEMALVSKNGGEGVGLYRTEFFYLDDGRLPTEDEQAANYARVAHECGDDGVIIRTFDLGGDKVHGSLAEPEPNPSLGWRGIRVSLAERDVFKTQLRAILRASASGRVRLMYPMVSSLEEVLQANAILEDCKRELDSEDVEFDSDIEVGVMIEVPSAAAIASQLAQEVSFFSFGTNDLVQYTLAVDRVNERVSNLYQPCHPAVLRFMKMSVDAARENGIWCGVCGEMAGDVAMTPLLVGLGVEELSVAASILPRIKFALRRLDSKKCEDLAAKALQLGQASEIQSLTVALARECYPELFA
jgi:phosphotransferase system enzyme I (PtsI)